MARLVDDLRTAVRSALETEEYRQRHAQIEKEFQQRCQKALADLAERSSERGVALIQTLVGFALVLLLEGKLLDPEAFAAVPDAEREEAKNAVQQFEDELEKLLHQIPQWQRESREKERALKRDVTRVAVSALIDGLPGKMPTSPACSSIWRR